MANHESTNTKPRPHIPLYNIGAGASTTTITRRRNTTGPHIVLAKKLPTSGLPVHHYAPFVLGLFLLTCIFVSLHSNMH